MGWNFVYQIARFRKVFVVTRENNKTHIEKYMKENPDPLYQNMNFLYFDLPYWMRFWKKEVVVRFCTIIYGNGELFRL